MVLHQDLLQYQGKEVIFNECKFQNTVLVEHPNFIIRAVSSVLGGFFVGRHNIEETPLFAENLYKKTFSE